MHITRPFGTCLRLILCLLDGSSVCKIERMNGREAEKKRREVAECESIAAAVNAKDGTDYVAKPCDTEPADVVLESSSDKYPNRMVQVVSIPHDYQIRADNKNVERLRGALTDSLKKRGVAHAIVGLSILGNTTKQGVPQAQVDHLAERIRDMSATVKQTGKCEIGYVDLLKIVPELSAYVSNVVVRYDEENPSVTVDTPGVAAQLPEDGSWIEQGINLKLKKYGGAEIVKDLTLVIGVEALVDRRQVEAFTGAHPPETLPFAEIWINSIEGAMCLKPRD